MDSLPAIPLAGDAVQHARRQYDLLKDVARAFRFRSIYVLIDRVDETEWTGNNAEKSYSLVASLLSELPLLDDPYVGWKFFLWDKLRSLHGERGRPDRIQTFDLEWQPAELTQMMSARLSAFSDGRVTSLSEITHTTYQRDIEMWARMFAHKSPRYMVRLVRAILTEQAELDATASSLSPTAINAGIRKAAAEAMTETYPLDHVAQVKRLGRLSFTITDVKEAHRESVNSSQNRVRNWTASGIAVQNGTIRIAESARRPSNYYVVTDPRVALSIAEVSDVAEFLQTKAISCANCQMFVFTEFEDRRDALVCPFCSKPARPAGS